MSALRARLARLTSWWPIRPSARRALSGAVTVVSVGLGLLHLAEATAGATTIPYRTDGDLVAMSDRVVHGRVVDVRTEAAAGTGRIYTITRLAVLEDLTGVDEREVEIRELGGRVGNREMWIPGAA